MDFPRSCVEDLPKILRFLVIFVLGCVHLLGVQKCDILPKFQTTVMKHYLHVSEGAAYPLLKN